MLNYPNKVRFGGVEFEVMLSDKPLTHPAYPGKLLNGACLTNEKLLLLHVNESCPTVTEETFIHEILEGVKDTYDLDMSHQTLKTIGVAFHQALAEAKIDFGQSALNTTVH